MFRLDWSKEWPNPELATCKHFPGVSLDTLKFLHLERRILFHGHELLDTDSTPTLEGEDWLLNNGYTQAEGVANLDQVPETGALLAIGFPKFQGGLGGYARYIAIPPPDWQYGVSVNELPEAPLAKAARSALGRATGRQSSVSGRSNGISVRIAPQPKQWRRWLMLLGKAR